MWRIAGSSAGLTVVTCEVYSAAPSAASEPTTAIGASCDATDTIRGDSSGAPAVRLRNTEGMELLFAVLLLVTMLLLDLQTRT